MNIFAGTDHQMWMVIDYIESRSRVEISFLYDFMIDRLVDREYSVLAVVVYVVVLVRFIDIIEW